MKRFASIILAAALMSAAVSRAGTDAAIEQTFDRNKGGVFAIYSRELRENPALQGKTVKIVFEIDIAADGLTTACRVKSSEPKAPEFESKLCARIKQIRFPARTAPTTYLKEVAFFPAA